MLFIFKIYWKIKHHISYQKCAAFHDIDKDHLCTGNIFDKESLKNDCFSCPYCNENMS